MPSHFPAWRQSKSTPGPAPRGCAGPGRGAPDGDEGPPGERRKRRGDGRWRCAPAALRPRSRPSLRQRRPARGTGGRRSRTAWTQRAWRGTGRSRRLPRPRRRRRLRLRPHRLSHPQRPRHLPPRSATTTIAAADADAATAATTVRLRSAPPPAQQAQPPAPPPHHAAPAAGAAGAAAGAAPPAAAPKQPLSASQSR